MRRIIAVTLALAGIAQASAAEERTDKIIIQGNPAGTQTVRIEPGGLVRAEYSYNDRGRGDHIVATWKLDADGIPIDYEGRGNDYMKAPVEERFEMKGGKASWKNRSEKGDIPVTSKAFYLPLDAPPEFLSVLARALLKAPDRKLALLPAGEASIAEAGRVATDKGELKRTDLARPDWNSRANQLVDVRCSGSVRSGHRAIAFRPTGDRQHLVQADRTRTHAHSER